jgi:hypothetical protein
MLTIFTIPKAFDGHTGIIQRNAIRSWTLLDPSCEIFLVGDDDGTDTAADDMGVKHIPEVQRNEFGTPLLDSAYQLAEKAASNRFICYVNADIILTNSILEAVSRVINKTDWFLMTGRRWNLDVSDILDFGEGWEDSLTKRVVSRGSLGKHTQIDLWVYPKGLLSDMPPFAVGRVAYECWCLYKAREKKAQLIDATSSLMSVHQNHDYSHHPQGEIGVGRGLEAQRNRELVGGKPYFFTIRDRTHILTKDGMKQARDGWRLWRGLRAAQVLPVSVPLPARLALNAANTVINAGRDVALRILRVRREWVSLRR